MPSFIEQSIHRHGVCTKKLLLLLTFLIKLVHSLDSKLNLEHLYYIMFLVISYLHNQICIYNFTWNMDRKLNTTFIL